MKLEVVVKLVLVMVVRLVEKLVNVVKMFLMMVTVLVMVVMAVVLMAVVVMVVVVMVFMRVLSHSKSASHFSSCHLQNILNRHYSPLVITPTVKKKKRKKNRLPAPTESRPSLPTIAARERMEF